MIRRGPGRDTGCRTDREPRQADAAILLLDNRDSFVFNLAQVFGMLGHRVHVERSDRITLAEIEELRPSALVLSPGPGRPENAGICVAAVRALDGRMPILGVCLGHQAIGLAFGASVRREQPCHGKQRRITHGGAGLFSGMPRPFDACRYHSLVVDPESMPTDLVADAWTEDGVLMGLHHRHHPTFGLQFHPESFRTQHGLLLLHNFVSRMR